MNNLINNLQATEQFHFGNKDVLRFDLKIARLWEVQSVLGPRGYSNYFLTGCAVRGLKPLPKSKDFSPSKNGWFYNFFEIFANQDSFLRVFLPQKWLVFTIFVKRDPLLSMFLTKMGPMSKDFCWKSNPFGWHIPIGLNMWVPPQGFWEICSKERAQNCKRHCPLFIVKFYQK